MRPVRMTWVYKTKFDGTRNARPCVQPGLLAGPRRRLPPGVERHSSRIVPTATRLDGRQGEAQHVRRWDFVAAYLQGDLLDDEVVYCTMPSGFEDGLDASAPTNKETVLRIEKPIYGMAQAGRRWQRTIFPYLIREGFVATESDLCVFVRRETVQTLSGPRKETLFVGVYVDDTSTTCSRSSRTRTSTRSTTPSPSSWRSTGRWRTRARSPTC